MLVFITLAVSMQKTLLVGLFELNKERIAKELCVEKDVEGSCCKGKCYLSKQLKQEESKGGAATLTFKDGPEITLFFVSTQEVAFADFCAPLVISAVSTPYLFVPGNGVRVGLLRPPLA